MDVEELSEWADDFEAFHARFAGLFGRSEPRMQVNKYLRGLLAQVGRKNGWQLAEAVGDAIPDRMQRLLYRSEWEADGARDLLQQFVVEVFGDEEAIGVVDETGFVKKGDRSVGVQRQYSGTAGKVENCQIGVLLSYATPQGHVFLDRRLYLPEEWCDDPQRRGRAKVPEEVRFQTKSEQAIAMLEQAWERGVPMRWVAGDEVYGDATLLRDTVTEHGRLYVLAVSRITPVWTEKPAEEEPGQPVTGRPRTRRRLAPGAPKSTTVQAVAAAWRESAWQRFAVAEGEKGPRLYDWACQRVIESRERLPGPEAWLVARRAVSDPADIAYFLSNAPLGISLAEMAKVAASRYVVEQCIEEAKGETGLDEYEVRHWHSWHRHITLSMMAHAWLASIRYKAELKKGRQSRFSPRSPCPKCADYWR
jgi:SRSO17 transposase